MINTLGSRIAEYRKAKGITQDQLAEHMGVSSQAVSKWENACSRARSNRQAGRGQQC